MLLLRGEIVASGLIWSERGRGDGGGLIIPYSLTTTTNDLLLLPPSIRCSPSTISMCVPLSFSNDTARVRFVSARYRYWYYILYTTVSLSLYSTFFPPGYSICPSFRSSSILCIFSNHFFQGPRLVWLFNALPLTLELLAGNSFCTGVRKTPLCSAKSGINFPIERSYEYQS